MGSVTLEFPIFIQTKSSWGKSSYLVRPLFMENPYSEHDRFSNAISGLMKEIRGLFRGFKVERKNINQILWFMFNPDVHFQSIKLDFYVGQRYISGKFTVVWFLLKEYRVVCLPAFDNFFFIAPKKENGRVNLPSAVQEVVNRLFREKRKKEGDSYDPKEYMTTKGENINVISLDIYVGDAPFPFESSKESFFATLFKSDSNFEGAWEIDRVGQDINNLYPNDLQRCFYRENLVERVAKILYGKENIPIALIGESGVGKSSVTHESVFEYMQKNEQSDVSKLAKMWHIDPTRLIAGMSVVGMWQKRLEAILNYVQKQRKMIKKKGTPDDIILFDNLIALLRVGKSAQNDMCVADVFKPYLEKRSLQIIVEATPQQWKLVQEWDRRFTDLFQVIRIEEPSLQNSTKIILKQRATLERNNNTSLENESLATIFRLQKTYLRQQKLPGNIIKFLKQITVKYKNNSIEPLAVYCEFQSISNMNAEFINPMLPFPKGLMEEVSEKLIGQEQAVNAIVDVIHLVKSGLSDPGKPFATYLFIGPTGVGKTEAAKVLVRSLFNDAQKIVRFDMNEFIDANAVGRLIGDFQQPEGLLTTKILHQPFCVLLFDEIEKAHPDIHDLLLQVLGEGRLTDSIGRTVDFSNTIIIMTSNIGAREVGQKMGFKEDEQQETFVYKKAVEDFFRPEFLNRIDKIVAFHKLSIQDLVIIARLQINKLLERDGFLRRTVIFNVSQKALEEVAKKGFDPDLGGRALKRSIEKDLTTLVAEKLVSISSEHSILFNIFICKNELLPHMLPLIQAKEYGENNILPLVTDEKLLPFLCDMQKRTLLLEDIIGENKHDAKDWCYYLFKDKLRDFQKQIDNDLWDLNNHEEEKNIEVKINVVPIRKSFAKSFFIEDTYLHTGDLVAHDQVVEYLQELYRNAPSFVTDKQQKSLDYFLTFSHLEFFANSIAKQQTDVVYFELKSCITNKGIKEINFLFTRYQEILNSLDISIECVQNKKNSKVSFIAEGPCLWDFFQTESGIHMFYNTHESPIPIRFYLNKMPKKANKERWNKEQQERYENWIKNLEKGSENLDSYPYINNEILRLYCLPSETTEGTITDLRTSFITTTQITLQDWLLFFFATKGKI